MTKKEQTEETEVINYTEFFNDCAERYKRNKHNAIKNLLLSGKILSECKSQLSQDQFIEWLNDYRVSESLRTAQRFLAIYADFGHLLDKDENMNVIDGLGVTHLLELKKLPDRFRKEVEVVYKDSDQEKHVIKKIIDTEKLSDFLDTTIEYKGKPSKMRDLPTSELHKQIRLVQGVYEPNNWGDRNDDFQEAVSSDDSDNVGEKNIEDDSGFGGHEEKKQEEIVTTTTTATTATVSLVRQLSGRLSGVLSDLHSFLPDLDKLDDSVINSCSDKDLEQLQGQVTAFLSGFEGLYLKFKELKEKL